MNLSPTRIDVLKDKHFAIRAWSKRADNMLLRSEEESHIKAVKRMVCIAEELLLLARTNDERGKQLGWWK